MQPVQIKAKPIFEHALGISDLLERRAYLRDACGADPILLDEVESLLEAFARSSSFLKPPQSNLTPRLGPQALPTTFGDYELLEEVARGGMGIVYRARQVSLNRIVAIKMILAGQFASEAEVRRFRTEAQAAASLTHPNIVSIYEVGEQDGHHYYSMPLVDGKSLEELVRSGHWLPADDAVDAARMVAKIARAVGFAHEAGILHRDLKPGNILIAPDGEPCITDFGLAKQLSSDAHLTLTGHLMGTPGFMAPEQARGRSGLSTAATDVYSLGAILYFLLTRQPPFLADSPLDAMLLALESEAVRPRRINPRVPGQLEHICLRCLEKRPEDRYGSAAALAADLERFLKGEALGVSQQSIGRLFESWARRQPALVARLGTVLLCLTVVVTAYQIHHYTSKPQHIAVILVLVFWVVISFLCQRGLENERHAHWIRVVWSAADPITLTALLLISQGFGSPLVVLYPTLIAASGFWLRVPLVATTTGTSLLGYVALLIDANHRGLSHVPFHWHVLAFVGIIVTGFSIVYLVNRVSALTRFYEQRPRSTRGATPKLP